MASDAFVRMALAIVMAFSPAVLPAFTSHTWSFHADDPDNIFTNTVHFAVSPEDIPPCDRVIVKNTSGDAVLRLPAKVDYSSTLAPHFRNDEGSLTVDLKDASWTQLNTDSGYPYIQDGRFMLSFYGSSVLQYAWPGAGRDLNGAFRMDDALLKLSRGNDGCADVDFLRGTFDFLSPNSVTNSGGYLYVAAGASKIFDMNFHAGSTFRAPIFFIYGTAPTNRINFLGGEHYINSLQMRVLNSGGNDTYDRTQVNITGEGTRLKIGNFTANSGERLHGYRIYVSDGGTLEAPCIIEQREGAASPVVFDSGRFDSTAKRVEWKDPLVYATNSVFEMDQVSLYRGKVFLKDTIWNSKAVVLGCATGEGSLVLDGGAMNTAGMSVGYNGGSSYSIDIVSGTLTANDSLSLGSGSGGFGRIALSGGELIPKTNLILGGNGSSELVVSGGRLTTPKINFVWNSNTKFVTNILRQTGGRIEVSSSFLLVPVESAENTYSAVVLEGGVLETPAILGGAGSECRKPENANECVLVGNGGTLRPIGASSAFVKDLSSAKCGPAGLAIDSDCDIDVPQGFSDLDGRGGELILAGSGVKTLSSATTSVSNIVLAGGTLIFAEGARAASNLIVTNGARVVFTDSPEQVGIRSFVCGDEESVGIVAVSADAPLDFGVAPVMFNNVRLELDGDIPVGSSATLVKTDSPVSGESRQAWMKALGEVGFLDDRSYGFFVGAPDGESLFSMTVSEAARKIAATEGDVAVSEDIAVGGMEMIVADVSQGASLELVGELSGGGLLKMGAGHLSVENGVNVLTRGVLLSEGYLSVGTFGALGYRPGFGGGLFLKGGTFEYRGDGSEASLPGTLTVAHPENHSPVLIKTESPVTVNGAIVKSGSIIKRGAAPLTFAPPSGTTTELAPYNGTGGGDPAPPYSIGDISGRSDLQPQSGYSGFNIAEGEVRLVGDSNTVFKISQGAMIGVSAVGGREQPALTIDGASVDFSGGSCTVQLCGWTRAGSFNVAPRLSLVNGANVKNYTFTCGRMCETPCYPTVTVDRATWKLTSFRPGYSSQVASQYFVNNGSRIDTQDVVNYGPAYLYVSNSVMTVATKADIHGSSGRWFFGEGSRLELSSITTTHDVPCSSFTLAFDGGEWETGGAVNLFRLYLAEKFHFETCGAGGLAMPIAQGVSLPVCRAITGNGGLVKTGGGTLAFMPQETWDEQFTEKTMLDDPVSLAFAGLLDVREGSVTVSEGACRAEGAYRAAAGANIDFGGNVLASASFSGAGSFANAVVENAVISVSSPSDVPTFDGVSFTGRVEVDFGIDGDAAGELRKNVAVARFADENAVLDVSRWRASNAGKGYTARFSVSGNEIVAEIAKFGTVLTVR